MTRPVVALATLLLALPTVARAQYGAAAQVSMTVSELTARELNGITLHVYDATLTWSGSCSKGNRVAHNGIIESSGPNGWSGGEIMPDGVLSGGGTHTHQNIGPGQVLRGVSSTACGDNAGSEVKDAKTQPYVLPPYIDGRPVIFTSTPAQFFHCLPVGTEVQLTPSFQNHLVQGEQVELAFKGAGVDFVKRFSTSDEITSTKLLLKATTTGDVEFTVTKLGSYDGVAFPPAKSNVFVIKADRSDACAILSGDGDPDPQDPGDDEEPDQVPEGPGEAATG
ncbi:MAG: hypothetical protein ACK4N5_16090, partial [Myxococcales bacterium]